MKPYININHSGTTFYFKDKEMQILHREDGPAIEWTNGDKEWYLNGKLHREDGPAFECGDGSKFWYINGEKHREDGPAVELADGHKVWYINGKKYTEADFIHITKVDMAATIASLK